MAIGESVVDETGYVDFDFIERKNTEVIIFGGNRIAVALTTDSLTILGTTIKTCELRRTHPVSSSEITAENKDHDLSFWFSLPRLRLQPLREVFRSVRKLTTLAIDVEIRIVSGGRFVDVTC
jgi:hypothetical protein